MIKRLKELMKQYKKEQERENKNKSQQGAQRKVHHGKIL
jgi:hypothetical protein